MVEAIEKEKRSARVPAWPWAPLGFAIKHVQWEQMFLIGARVLQGLGADDHKILVPSGHLDDLGVALVLGVWCLVALVLCLTTFRWTTKRDG